MRWISWIGILALPITATAGISQGELDYIRDFVDHLFKKNGMELTADRKPGEKPELEPQQSSPVETIRKKPVLSSSADTQN